jgi:hypothetical protein
VIGFQALLAPWAVPLALSVAALGVWILRAGSPNPGAQRSPTEATPLPATPPE